MISAYQFILLIFSMQVVGLFEYCPLPNSMKLSLKWCHSSFIMYICNQNHLKACYYDDEIFNICTFCMRVITSITLLSSAMIFLNPLPLVQ